MCDVHNNLSRLTMLAEMNRIPLQLHQFLDSND